MEPQRLPDIMGEALVLEVPNPPAGTRYEDYEDFRSAELLRANGIEPDVAGVLDALQSRTGVLLAAAAHTAGARGFGAALPTLEGLRGAADDTVAVEAAYALIRLGVEDGHATLQDLLRSGGPLDLGRLRAAGYLAATGDPSGYQAIADGLHSEHMVIRMTACKQLYAFVPLDGTAGASGEHVDAGALFRTALADSDADVRWQALAQVRALATQPASDESVRRLAEQILGEAETGA
jgi:hypothetical protein